MKGRVAMLAMLAMLAVAFASRPIPQPPEPLLKLHVAYRARLSHAPMLIAEEEGFFRRQGLEIEFHRMERSKDGLPALIAGDLDVLSGFVGPSYFNAIARGAGIRIVADKGYFDPGGCTNAALVTTRRFLKEGRLQRPIPARAWRISARPGSITELLLDRALAREAIPRDQVSMNWVEAISEAEALKKGMTDVAFVSGLEGLRPDPSLVTWYAAQELAPELSLFVVLYGPRLLKKEPDAGRRFMTAFIEGARQYNAGKTERNLAILDRRLGYDRATLRQGCWIRVRDDGKPDLPSLQGFQEWALRKGLLDRILIPAEFWDPQFVDSAAQALRKP